MSSPTPTPLLAKMPKLGGVGDLWLIFIRKPRGPWACGGGGRDSGAETAKGNLGYESPFAACLPDPQPSPLPL